MSGFSRRHRLLGIGVILGLVGMSIAALLTSSLRARKLDAELERIRRELSEGRFALARGRLAELAKRSPRDGEILFLLGRCEETLGRPERALAAWEQVRPSDPAYGRAVESLGMLLMNLGRYAPAESLLTQALGQVPESDRYAVLRALARLFRLEGRFPEVSDVLTAAWRSAPNPSDLLQDLWQNDTEAVPINAWKFFLDAADDRDDRVWLARARLALVSGRLDDAENWLRRCVGRRPDDPAVWRARLDLAIASEDASRFWEAACRIPVGAQSPSELAATRCWLASRGHDRQAEAREWTRRLEIQPSSSQAFERLAALATEKGDHREAERLRHRKAEADHAKDAIHKLVVRAIEFQPHAHELARHSAILGRQFDENAWSLVATSAPSGSPQGRASPPPRGDDPDFQKRRVYCRTVSDAALARLLAGRYAAYTPGADTIADRLADLRAAFEPGAELAAQEKANGAEWSQPLFLDHAEASGLTFSFDNGRSPLWLLPESLSGGVGLVDFDGDGWLDVYCVQGGSFVDAGSSSPALGDRLFHNQGDGTFRDVTRETGIDRLPRGRDYGLGIAVGDYDNDGHADLFITRLRRYDLLRNRGDGTFEDVTESAGLGGERSSPTSAAFADLDADGDLDLYVCHYVRWDPDHPPRCKNDRWGYYYCDPALYESAADHVFRNDGGRFVDVTAGAGFADQDGRGLGVLAADLDGDRRVDLFVANDGTANFLFRNLGGFQFEDVALTVGAAGNAEGAYRAGMGVASADLDGDERPDLLVTNLYGEGLTLYHNLGQGIFADESAPSGFLQATRYLTGFGIAVLDAANTGRLNVAIANGHVNDFRPVHPFAMPSRLYEQRTRGRWIDISDRSGPPWSMPRLGRGLVAGDLDNDGRVDLLIVAQDGPLACLHNESASAGHFVVFRVEGTNSNRDAVGASLEVAAAGRRQVAQRLGGGSYLSASDDRLHFGLGIASEVDSVAVRWPSGRVDRWEKLAADAAYLLREGDPTPRPLPGFRQKTGAPVRPNRRGDTGNREPACSHDAVLRAYHAPPGQWDPLSNGLAYPDAGQRRR